jgi:hypothetical protein
MIKMFFKFLFSSRASVALMPAMAVDPLSCDEGYLPAFHAALATPEAYPPEDEQELNQLMALGNRFRVGRTGLLR